MCMLIPIRKKLCLKTGGTSKNALYSLAWKFVKLIAKDVQIG